MRMEINPIQRRALESNFTLHCFIVIANELTSRTDVPRLSQNVPKIVLQDHLVGEYRRRDDDVVGGASVAN